MTLLSSLLLLSAAAFQLPSDYEDAGMTDLQRRQLVYDFGRCVVKGQAERAGRVIAENVSAGEIMRKHARLIDGNCLIKAWPDGLSNAMYMTLPGDLMRYSLADALVAREYTARLPADLSARAPLQHGAIIATSYEPKPGEKLTTAQIEALVRNRAKVNAVNLVARFGECVVRADPATSHRLVMQKPGSPEERAAFVALQPAFDNCLEVGQTFSASLTVLRGTIALNAYRLARAPVTTAGAAR